MANTTIDLVGLDFDSLKSNLKSFLKNNTQFKDIDYEGSNISVLLDVLAYNTYLNGFYTNMVASEMFLDTAQLKDSVVSHAKELNYVPRSFNSAQAQITVDITPSSSVSSVVIPKYTTFTTRVGSNTYTFSSNEAYVMTATTNGKYTKTLTVYEGQPTIETFVVNQANTRQRFVISNPTVDISSFDVDVYENGGQVVKTYLKKDNIIGITNTSPVFFVQGAENEQYELVFGDDVFGRKPKDGSTIVVRYRAASGQLPNGARLFLPDGPIDSQSNINITTVSTASGGAVSETIESIRYNAPRSFQAQDRAVTSSDYETLLTNRFSDIQAISVYGGEDEDPPQFGKVFIAIDLFNADGISDSRKAIFQDYISTKTPLTIRTEFTNPEFMYAKVKTSVLYDTNSTKLTSADISALVQAAISNYNVTSLEDFNVSLYYSDIVQKIDSADVSILSNDSDIRLAVRLLPETGTDFSTTINTRNKLSTAFGLVHSAADKQYGLTLTSSTFTYNGARCIFVDDAHGNIYIVRQKTTSIDIIKQIGTINYATGVVKINKFNVDAYDGNYIELILKPDSKNIHGTKNLILKIDPLDVSVVVTGTRV